MNSRRGHPRWVAVLVILGTILAVVAIFSIWANRQALNTDNWVHTSDRILANEKVEERLSDYLADQLFANVDVEAELEKSCRRNWQPLAGAGRRRPHQLAPKVAERALENPQVQALWAAPTGPPTNRC